MTDIMEAEAALPADGRDPPRWLRRLRAWHRREIAGLVDHPVVLDRVHGEAQWSQRYAFMICMSAGIAILGLLQSSPAVIIGAMLISPLMGPIIGLGFALATFDWDEARRALLALVLGTALAVTFTAVIVLMSPLQDITPEILARTRPSLFDLLVAVFSALAGGYATVRGRGETIVGVAIATALMPPLAVVGFGLATGNMAVFSGAFVLFMTNFIAIALSAAIVARFYGFGSELSPSQSRRQGTALVVLLLALAIPLGWSLRQIAWEAWASRMARTAVSREFGDQGRIVSLDPDYAQETVKLRVTVLTDRLHSKAGADLEARLTDTLARPVQVQLSQVLINQPAPGAELSRARDADSAMRSDMLARADMAARLSLVAGVPVEQVLVDPVARTAAARVTDGRTLTELMAAETRLASDSPGWTVRLLPPAGPLPPIEAERAEDPASFDADIAAMAWALERAGTNGAAVTVRQLVGETRAAAEARGRRVADALAARGIVARPGAMLPPDRNFEREEGLDAARAIQVEPLAPVPAAEPGADAAAGAESAAEMARDRDA